MNELLTYIDYLGTLAFAISGVLIGTEKKFDLFGVLILGFVTAIGGSTLRDLLIGVRPVGWMQNEVYLYLIFSAVPIVYFFKSTILKWRKGVFMFDTIGIGVFTIIGVQKTLSVGVVSAVFGGVLRDVLSNEIPLIFRKEIYAFACLVGAVTFLISDYFLWHELAIVISIAVVILVRISAILLKWELPFNVRTKN